MSVSNVAMKAYSKALEAQRQAQQGQRTAQQGQQSRKAAAPAQEFAQAFSNSIKKVNDLQTEKAAMVDSFAAGETGNVHELMIQMQKAGLAINMTNAVRNKILSAYQEIMRMPF